MLTTRIDELAERAGTELGTSDWVAVTQEAVDAFAAATGDHQWIHTVPERAADSPFGGTIAHGYYTLPTGEQVRMRVGLDAVEPVPGGAALFPEPDVRARGGRQAGVRRERRLPRLRAEVI
jgi:acyl dehydratase